VQKPEPLNTFPLFAEQRGGKEGGEFMGKMIIIKNFEYFWKGETFRDQTIHYEDRN